MARPPKEGSGDPSMDDILASIRRIMNEDEAASAPHQGAGDPPRRGDGEMPRRGDGEVPRRGDGEVPRRGDGEVPRRGDGDPPRRNDDVLLLDPSMMIPENEPPASTPAAAGPPAGTPSLGELVRRVSADRAPPAAGRGPTVEELVREELRPVLKAWLDANLPPLVERLARAEIERLVRQAASDS